MPLKHLIFFAFLVCVVSACGGRDNPGSAGGGGSQGGGNAPVDRWPRLYASKSELPECTEPKEGLLVYLSSESGFNVCSAGEWKPINLTGPIGPVGPSGASGQSGVQGPKGGSSLVTVYDASNQKVGWLLSERSYIDTANRPYLRHSLPVLLTDGMIAAVNFESGCIFPPSNVWQPSVATINTIYYENASCQGEARAYYGGVKIFSPKVYVPSDGSCGAMKLTSQTDLGPFTFLSSRSYDANGNWVCTNNSSTTNPFSYAVGSEVFTPSLPLSLRGE